MLGNFSCVLSSAYFFSKSSFSKTSFRNTIIVRPDLGANCLQRLSADGTSNQRVKVGVFFRKVNSVVFCVMSSKFLQCCYI